MANSKYEYVKLFELKDNLLPQTWMVLRIDGCHFHKFSQVHDFEKPNDERALCLMNECATDVLQEFPDMLFAYGVSDEYVYTVIYRVKRVLVKSIKVEDIIHPNNFVNAISHNFVLKKTSTFHQRRARLLQNYFWFALSDFVSYCIYRCKL